MAILIDRLGRIVCPKCARPMRLVWLETSTEFHRGEYTCVECDLAQEVKLPRGSIWSRKPKPMV